MKDSIFVAHNANFDYNFLNHSFERFGLGCIGNQKLSALLTWQKGLYLAKNMDWNT